jgi:hypothetical protein
VIGDIPLSWLDGPSAQRTLAKWVQTERTERVAAANRVERQRQTDPEQIASIDALRKSATIRGFSALDDRTLPDFVAELDAWAEQIQATTIETLRHNFLENGYGLVRFRVSNNSDQFLPGVELRLQETFEPMSVFTELPPGPVMPTPPRAYGQSIHFSRVFDGWNVMAPLYASGPIYLHDLTATGNAMTALDVGDLRPCATYESDDFHLLLVSRPDSGEVRVDWTATVHNRNGLTRGHVLVPVGLAPVDPGVLVSEVFDAPAGGQSG